MAAHEAPPFRTSRKCRLTEPRWAPLCIDRLQSWPFPGTVPSTITVISRKRLRRLLCAKVENDPATFAFCVRCSTNWATTFAKPTKMDPNITKMYYKTACVRTVATTSTNTYLVDFYHHEERCYPDLVEQATSDGCSFTRPLFWNKCNATFTHDESSDRYDAMNVTCVDEEIEQPPVTRKTHEQIVFQALEDHPPAQYPRNRPPICAVFKVTYLEDRPGTSPDYVLRLGDCIDYNSTACWEVMVNKTIEVGKKITMCPVYGVKP
ncbi:uncharacterized protein LOC142587021 isoform X2 [Dermacentor variabilis]|uniref:uncharacterized protein LOC142587021 isoform X2 n=1 Tax=Dermacentor variabilis TaxID=34621 RepID=UPI003F5BF864